MIRHGAWVVATAVAVLLFWAPWPFASVTAVAATFLQVGFAGALVLGVVLTRDLAGLRRVAWPAASLVALALYGGIQGGPLPAGLVEALSPEHARLARSAYAALEPTAVEAAPEPGAVESSAGGVATGLSLAPGESRRTALLLASLAAALGAGALAGAVRRPRRLVPVAVVAAACGQVLYGAPRWIGGVGTVWGVDLGAHTRLRGTFVNPNHLAYHLEIALALVFAWGWWSLSRAVRERRTERRVLLVAGPGLVWLVLFTALAFTGSRAGLAAVGAATALQGVLVAASGILSGAGANDSQGRGRRWMRRAVLAASGVAALVAGVGLVLMLGAEEGLGRLVATSTHDVTLGERVEVYRASLELWRRFPLWGTGLGSFMDAFPLVQPRDLPLLWRHAHSGPLELLVTGGLVAAAVAAVGLGALVLRLARVLRTGRRTEDRAAAVAALGALAATGLHELVDFGWTIPAVGFTLAAVLGAAAAARCGQGGRRRRRADGPPGGGGAPRSEAPPDG